MRDTLMKGWRGHIILFALFVFMQFSFDCVAQSNRITGKIVQVDSKKGIIYVMHDSRIIRFYAQKEFCQKYKNKTNYIATIEYEKCKNKGLCAVSIEEVTEDMSVPDSDDDISMTLVSK